MIKKMCWNDRKDDEMVKERKGINNSTTIVTTCIDHEGNEWDAADLCECV